MSSWLKSKNRKTHYIIAQSTFALLMKAQQRTQPRIVAEPSYKYFNTPQIEATPACQKCSNSSIYDKCMFCEKTLCVNCLQHCSACQYLFCSACSIMEYVYTRYLTSIY